MAEPALTFAGLCAIVSAAAVIIGFVTLIMFFVTGEPWGTMNDIASIVIALSVLTVLVQLYLMSRVPAPLASFYLFLLGIMAMLLVTAFQTLLVARLVTFTQTAIIVPLAFGLFGAVLMFYSYVGWTAEVQPRGLAALGFAAGAGYLLTIAGFLAGGQNHPLTVLGGLAAVICYPPWAFLLGLLLLSGGLGADFGRP